CLDALAQIKALATVLKPRRGDCRKRCRNPVEPLVAQNVLDHLAADERRVVDQLAQHRGGISAAAGADKAVDKGLVDVGPEPGRGDQSEARCALRMAQGEEGGYRSPHRMADKMDALDAKRLLCRFDGVGQGLGIAGTNLLGRTAMPR